MRQNLPVKPLKISDCLMLGRTCWSLMKHPRREARAKRACLPGSPLEKLRLPYRGRMLLIPKKAFPRQITKRLLGRDEFFQRIFLHKSQDWVIVGRQKERGLLDGKRKQKTKKEIID